MASDSFKSPRLGLGLSEERKIAIKQANKLKQELYAQQKKIQFSNLLERANDDLDAYIESQENVFITSRSKPADNGVPETGGNSPNSEAVNSLSPDAASFETNGDDGDGFDFFRQNTYAPSSRLIRQTIDFSDDPSFDPEESVQETLHDHLLRQLNLDGKYSSLPSDMQARPMAPVATM